MNFSTFQPIKPASLRSDKRFAQRGWRRHWIGILLSSFSFQLFGVSVFAATYYIDYSSGSDSNSGTSTNAPWQRAPGMVAFSGSYSHSAGDVFIFKGGVTWPASSLGMVITQGGSATNPDIYESSTNWFSGASWPNACFDGQYTPVSFGGYSSLITVK